MFLVINVILFTLIILGLILLNQIKSNWNLSKKVLIGLICGVVYGSILQFTYGNGSNIISQSLNWFDIVGKSYVQLLQMVIMPLILFSILSAVAKLHDASSLGKISVLTISMLLFTTFLSAIIGIFITLVFGLSSEGLISGAEEASRLVQIESHHLKTLDGLNIPQLLLQLVPKNPFLDLTGARATSIISVVIFSVFLGLAALKLYKDDPKKGKKIIQGIEILQSWIMKLIRIVMSLTPYGVFALMVKVSASSNIQDIIKLGSFMVASYIAIGLMFLIHALFVSFTGISPIQYFKKISSVMAFAFTSRSSAASIPLNIETQVHKFGIPDGIACFSASFGTTIGQNGCAGVYPAMLAVMVAVATGVQVDFQWLALLTLVITLSSIGVAGVGGGATFAALIVLPIMNLPIELIALLISIEPLIDMARTALNVSGSITAGVITSKILGQTDTTIIEEK